MERVSLTYFVDFVLKVGTPKLTGVKELKEGRNEIYTDFYRPLREAMVDMHERGEKDAVLDDLLASLQDERKRRIFPSVVAGYRKFLKQSEPTWFRPPLAAYPLGDIEINVNPELGFHIGGKPHIIKAYFRGESLAQKRVSIVLNLLSAALRAGHPGAVFGMLDVKNGKLHTLKAAPNPKVPVLLRGEAASFATIYAAV